MNKLLLTAYGFSTPSIKDAVQKMIREKKVTKACIISTSWPKEKEKTSTDATNKKRIAQHEYTASRFPRCRV